MAFVCQEIKGLLTYLLTYIIGDFGDESSQAINCAGTDNEKVTN